MRYYVITVTNPTTGAIVKKWSSLDAQGNFNPNAQTVEFDLPVTGYAIPAADGFVRVWGISLQEIGPAAKLAGMTIKIEGGMSKGYPLANPAQAGVLVEGTIRNAWGNWQGTAQTLDMLVYALAGTQDDPVNLIQNWLKGTKLSVAIKSTLLCAFPGYTAQIAIKDELVLTQDEPGYYQTLSQFAAYIKQVSQSIIGGSYTGVEIIIRGKVIHVYDGSQISDPNQISFTDLLGQASWISPYQINVKCVLRADLAISDYIQLPKGLMTTTAQSLSAYRDESAFKGTYQIDSVRHVGNSRMRDANAWATNYTMHLTG